MISLVVGVDNVRYELGAGKLSLANVVQGGGVGIEGRTSCVP